MSYRVALCIKHLERREVQLIYIIRKFTCKLRFRSRVVPVYLRPPTVNHVSIAQPVLVRQARMRPGSEQDTPGVAFLA